MVPPYGHLVPEGEAAGQAPGARSTGTPVWRARGEDAPVTTQHHRGRNVLGIAVTAQSVALVVAALLLTCLVSLAVLAWLERSA